MAEKHGVLWPLSSLFEIKTKAQLLENAMKQNHCPSVVCKLL